MISWLWQKRRKEQREKEQNRQESRSTSQPSQPSFIAENQGIQDFPIFDSCSTSSSDSGCSSSGD